MILIAVSIVCMIIFRFLIEVPSQLKRIADALEKENKDGKF